MKKNLFIWFTCLSFFLILGAIAGCSEDTDTSTGSAEESGEAKEDEKTNDSSDTSESAEESGEAKEDGKTNDSSDTSKSEEERDYYYWDEIVSEELLDQFQQVVSDNSTPINVSLDEKLKIALIFPALDLSDAWYRGEQSLKKRLDELQIPYELRTMGSETNDHALQSSHIDTVMAEGFDYVIIAPTELYVHKGALERLIDSDAEVIIWDKIAPFKEWGTTRDDKQPLAWVGFDHHYGGQILGDYVVERYPSDSKVAMMYGVPGTVSIQRGETARDIMKEAGMEIVYEHYAHWDRNQAHDAARNILMSYDIDLIHVINTSMAGGVASAVRDMGYSDEVAVNGWGGGSEEQELLETGDLSYTILRMQDDWGVALAEVIKYHLEDRTEEIPLVYAGKMVVVDDETPQEQINEYLEYAFRYSGDLEH